MPSKDKKSVGKKKGAVRNTARSLKVSAVPRKKSMPTGNSGSKVKAQNTHSSPKFVSRDVVRLRGKSTNKGGGGSRPTKFAKRDTVLLKPFGAGNKGGGGVRKPQRVKRDVNLAFERMRRKYYGLDKKEDAGLV